MKEIKRIIQRYDEACQNEELLALGTVVKVEGSAYRRIGARLLVNNTGQWVGGISGGCLEGDALKRAKMAILQDESSIVVYDTTEDDPHQIGVGLGCNGRIEVLFTPIKTNDKNNQIEFLKQIVNKRAPTALLQILSVKNGDISLCGQFFTQNNLSELVKQTQVSIPQIQEGLIDIFYKRKSNIFILQNEDGATYEILFEHIRPKIKLICVGDNYDISAMVNVANELGWEIHLIGKTRKIGKKLLGKVTTFSDVKNGENISIDEYTAVVLMSHDYKTDLELLKSFIHLDLPYIGLLGPKKRMLKMNDEIININLEQQNHLYSPIGLDIGAETPEEIALSIAAEIIAVFRKREGHFLKNRIGFIHERITL
jgi:xanthine/CO dehydrogenase XdhC/CoxF family maturation factor